MPELSLEERVEALEEKVAQLQTEGGIAPPEKPWLRTLGMFAGDEGMKEVFEEALKLREKDRQNARRLSKKSAARGTKP